MSILSIVCVSSLSGSSLEHFSTTTSNSIIIIVYTSTMYIYIYMCVRLYIHTHTHTYVYIYMCMSIKTCIVYNYIYMYRCMFWGEFVVAFLGDVVLFFSLGHMSLLFATCWS
jgi:hypothetical protein